jgi:GNAT superfamily N-acetyltransferase
MASESRDWTAPALAVANERNLVEAFTSFGRVPGAAVDTSAAWTIAASGLPVLNAVLHARLPPDEVTARIDAAKAWCAARRIPLTWVVGPTSTPADLGARLAAHGLTPIEPWVGMARRLDAALPEPTVPVGYTLEPATDDAGLGGVARAAVGGFGMDGELVTPVTQFLIALTAGDSPWRFYLARDGDAAVATAGLFLGSEVAGIYIVATVPAARRRGLGAAVTAAALRDARDSGQDTMVLQASRMGHAVYQRLGFADYDTFGRYRWVPPTP